MDNIFEKISLTLILLKIFDIYFFCYLATNEKIAITHLWHATEPQTMYHLIAKNKVAEQHILGKHSKCNSFGVTMALLNSQKFQSSYYSAIQGATGLKLYYVIAYQKVDGQHI